MGVLCDESEVAAARPAPEELLLQAVGFLRENEIEKARSSLSEAQKLCDSEMESNFHAGRTRGAWKAKDTLKNRGFIKEQGFTTYTPNGFRDRPHTFSLTRDGELFINALLANRPEAVDAARQAAGRAWAGGLAGWTGGQPRQP